MKPLKRTVINTVLFLAAYVGVGFAMSHTVEWKELLILLIVYIVLNYAIYTILDKVSENG